MNWTWELDGWIVVAGVLCAVNAALLGTFLVLRRMSLLGDAISHAVLPGLAGAFLLTGSRGSMTMFAGAVCMGLLTAVLTQWIQRRAQVDEGASLGVVFTTLFALGLVMNAHAAKHVDLDTECVLYGNLEAIPFDKVPVIPGFVSQRLGLPQSVAGLEVPAVVWRLALLLIVNGLCVWWLFKEFRISAFDPDLADSQGIGSQRMHYLLMVLVAVTAVASFESVGNILVVAMFVVPPAAATMITGRLSAMIGWSLALAVVAGASGHWMAVQIPQWSGMQSTNTAGMMAVAAGLLFVLAWLAGPRQGIAIRWWRQKSLSRRILEEDVLAWLYRQRERKQPSQTTAEEISTGLTASLRSIRSILKSLGKTGLLLREGQQFRLTESGLSAATNLIRSHRLWEQFLVNEMNLPPDRIHGQAERLEHFTGEAMRQRLDEQTSAPVTDPHGSPIPREPKPGD